MRPTDTITFEQPLNDHIRICLRLEHLFQQLATHLENPSIAGSKTALIAIVKVLEVIDRPDLKSKLTQCLTQLATTLGQLEQFSQVDSQKLKNILRQLDELIDNLHRNHQKIGASLHKNEFLNQIRKQMLTPGGACNYKSPAYSLWLTKPAEDRIQDLNHWMKTLAELRSISQLVLRLTRESTPDQTIRSDNGFYQQALDSTLPCQMVRVILPASYGVYPEISVGKHRLNIRFVKPDYLETGKPSPYQQPIEFQLNCCRL